MKIIVLGAGRVGSTIARTLAKEGHDITVIDRNRPVLRELQDQADIATVLGVATYPESLLSANIKQAKVLISVLPDDEDNIVACQVARALYQTPSIIARIRNKKFLEYPGLFSGDHIFIDSLIRPDALVTQYVQRLIEYPRTIQIHNFADDHLKLVTVNIDDDSPAIGMSIRSFQDSIPSLKCLSLTRNSHVFTVERKTIIENGDCLTYLVPSLEIDDSLALCRVKQTKFHNIMIAGGGHIGLALAENLQQQYKLKVIEKNEDNVSELRESLPYGDVLLGDATDKDWLVEEGLADVEVFCAITSSDEANILSCLLAKEMGVERTICLVNKPAYVKLIPPGSIDIVFTPGRITSAYIMRYVRNSIINVCPIHETSLEALEIDIKGQQDNSRVIGLNIQQLNLPKNVIFGVLVRDNKVMDSHDNITIENGDRVILLAPEKQTSNIERYFSIVD